MLIVDVYFQDLFKWQSRDPVAFQMTSPGTFMINMKVVPDSNTDVLTDICHRHISHLNIRCLQNGIPKMDFSEYPERKKLGNCVLMSLLNLAVPLWKKFTVMNL